MATTHDKLFPLFVTSDLAACHRFYVDSLGWTEVARNDHYLQVRRGGEDGPELCFMTPNASPQMRLEPFQGQGVVVSIGTPDADAWFATLRGRGVATLGEPSDKPWGWRSFLVRDPAGVVLDFFHPLARVVSQ
jgi:catechol 2,3-dioxygenase-like lactoylglutathione lyase family enzyme